MKKKNIWINYIYNLSYQILAILAPLITTPYVSRILGAEGIGIYSYTSSISTYFGMISVLGLGTLGQLRCSRCRDDKRELSNTFWEIFLSRCFLSSILIVLYLIFCFCVRTYQIIYLILTANLISGLLDIGWFYQGLEDFKRMAQRNFFIKILSIVLIFLLVKSKDDLIIYIIVIQGSMLLGNFLLWFKINKYLLAPKLSLIHPLRTCTEGIVYFIPTIASSIYTVFDKAMIGLITGSSFENGYYEQAYKIQQLAVTVVTALSAVTLPRMAYLHSKHDTNGMDKVLKSSISVTGFLSYPIAFGLFGISRKLIPCFLGAEFEPSILLLQLMCFMVIAIGFDNLFGNQCLIPCGKQRLYNTGVIAGAVINLILNAILIPQFASLGASVASVVAEFVIMLLFAYFSREMISLMTLIKLSWKYIVSSFGMAAILRFVDLCIVECNWGSVGILIVLGVVVYIILLIVLQEKIVWDIIRFIISKRKKV